jgi:hypothetical protein
MTLDVPGIVAFRYVREGVVSISASEERENYQIAESALYDRVESYLLLRFQHRLKPMLGECLPPITAITARANMAGQWTRPDVGLIAVWKNRYSAKVNLDVYGFEVKTRKGCTLTAVHEALAQNRVVHFSYLVWHLPESDLCDEPFEKISKHCEAIGIGLITFSRSYDADSFIVHLQAKRGTPASDAIDEFIEAGFSAEDRTRLLRLLPSLGSYEKNRDS